jgi:ABC-type transport system involved in multi-copper enzyme maturation permease subunit
MNGLLVIFGKEWRFFTGSDRGVFVLYLFLILSWSIMLVAPHDTTFQSGQLWLLFFSVIISANFTNTVFIAERVNGILEILITSGLTRRQILFGKMLFVAGMSTAIGVLCSGFSLLWRRFIYSDGGYAVTVSDLLLYIVAVYFNTASSAYLSVRMNNPRLLHLVNLLFLACIVTAYTVAAGYYTIPLFALPLFLFVAAGVLTAASAHIYESEKILQPVTL